jgi:hypothetical protein
MNLSVRLLPLLLAPLLLVGCAARSVSVARPAAGTKVSVSGAVSDRVDTKRIELDVKARTVTLYQVEGGHWLVVLPDKPQEKIDGLVYRVPEGVKFDEVEVYHLLPGGGSSNAVKLSEVTKK